ncbi:hypothetical protein Plhal304r1_c071g0159631 [Plasmopara halstedii]
MVDNEDLKLPLLKILNNEDNSCIRNHYMQPPSLPNSKSVKNRIYHYHP